MKQQIFSLVKKSKSILRSFGVLSFFLVISLNIIQLDLHAQEQASLSVSSISEKLKRKANAVVRFDDTKVILKAYDEYEEISSSAITVFSEEESGLLRFRAFYKEGSEKISEIALSYYNKDGELMKKVKSKDIEDQLASSASELVGDNRLKTYRYVPTQYPVTIVARYKKTSRNTMFLPTWFPILDYNISVQNSSYKLENTSSLPLRWSPRNFQNYKNINATDLSFYIEDQAAVESESYSPSLYEVFPIVYVIPEKYSYEGNSGSHRNWLEFGSNKYRQFLSDKNNLNAQRTKKDLESKINTNVEIRELIKALFNFVQEQTRYILITLGDGGYAPLTAQKVHDVKYGDCKALSFYLKSLLELYGISSNYVQIHADSDIPLDLYEDFAHPAPSNHIILNVPMEEDTIWLDCTSHDNPFNYLGSFTDDRLGLEVTPEGGRLVRTPSYSINENVQMLTGEITIDKYGQIESKIDRVGSGLFYEDGIGLSKLSQKEKMEYLTTYLFKKFNRLKIISNDLSLNEADITYKESYDFTASDYATVSGDYMLLDYKYLSLPIVELTTNKGRVNDIFFPRDHRYVQTMKYNLPAGYSLNVPAAVTISDVYGSYNRVVEKSNDGSYVITRTYEQFKGRYPSEDYTKIKYFFDLVRRAEEDKFSISIIN